MNMQATETEKLKAKPDYYLMQDYDSTAKTHSWEDTEKQFSWYETGQVNMAHEAIDRHTTTYRKNKVALYFDDGKRKEAYTFNDMKMKTNQVANVLTKHTTLVKGDRLFIYMPRSPELYFTLLGALKMGVIVGPLFEAFMEAAVYDRLHDSDAKVLVTTPELLKRVPLDKLPTIEKVFLVGDDIEETDSIKDLTKQMQNAEKTFDVVWVEREDGMILHYTSGSTGTPKGVLHVHNAMLQQYQSSQIGRASCRERV